MGDLQASPRLEAWGRQPVLSPDGNPISFVGETPEQQGVYAIHRSREGASLRKVTDLVPPGNGLTRGGISLSPDGEWIALFGVDDDRQQFGDSAVPRASGKSNPHRFDPATGEITHDLGLGFPPAWSREGGTLAWPSRKERHYFEVLEVSP